MKKHILLTIFLSLIACLIGYFCIFISPLYFVTHPEILYIGDSLCEATHDGLAPSLTSFSRIAKDCKGGRKSIEYSALPENKKVIFYALGTNDKTTPIDVYRNDLQKKLQQSNAKKIFCILPDNKDDANIETRKAMVEICPTTIEPREHGYLFSAKDGIHGTAKDHARFGKWLKVFIAKNNNE